MSASATQGGHNKTAVTALAWCSAGVSTMRGGTRCSMYSYDCSALWKYTAALYRPRLRSGRHYGLRGAGRKCCTRPEVDDERPGRPESPVGPVSTKILPVAVCLSNSDGQTLSKNLLTDHKFD